MGNGSAVRLLVWDDPDMRSGLERVLVAESDVGRPDLGEVFTWLAGRCAPDEAPEACLFLTVEPGSEAALAAEVTAIREQGFAVHARRPLDPAHSVDGSALSEPMWSMIEVFARTGRLQELVVATHDAGAFGARLDQLAANTAVVVLGFRELAGFAVRRSGITFVDIEDVPEAFGDPLPRTNLYDLPEDGRTLPPLRRPTAAMAPTSSARAEAPPATAPAGEPFPATSHTPTAPAAFTTPTARLHQPAAGPPALHVVAPHVAAAADVQPAPTPPPAPGASAPSTPAPTPAPTSSLTPAPTPTGGSPGSPATPPALAAFLAGTGVPPSEARDLDERGTDASTTPDGGEALATDDTGVDPHGPAPASPHTPGAGPSLPAPPDPPAAPWSSSSISSTPLQRSVQAPTPALDHRRTPPPPPARPSTPD